MSFLRRTPKDVYKKVLQSLLITKNIKIHKINDYKSKTDSHAMIIHAIQLGSGAHDWSHSRRPTGVHEFK